MMRQLPGKWPGHFAAVRFLIAGLVVVASVACAAPVAQARLPASTPTPGPWLPVVPFVRELDTVPPETSIVWRTADGPISAIETSVPRASRGILLLSGADGGFNGPESGLYQELARRLHADGVMVLRVAYRHPAQIVPSLEDARVALNYLLEQGVSTIAVVGFSFGGAVAIETAAETPTVRAVLTLSSQNADTEHVGRIAPRPLTVIHAVDDQVVPSWAARDIFARAGDPKDLILLPSQDHYLSDADPSLADTVVDRLLQELPANVDGL